MALFAKIENNFVVNVIVAEQDFADTLDGLWVKCPSQFGIGDEYDPDTGEIYPPQPFPSWVKDTSVDGWKAPVDVPDDAGFGEGEITYRWDEDTLSWVVVT